MKPLLLLPILLFSMMPAFADEAILGISSNDGNNLKSMSVGSLEDGLQIESVTLQLSTDTETSKVCQLHLIDKILNRVPISDKFQCDKPAQINLNQAGNDVIESKTLTGEIFQILLVTDKINDNTKTLNINSIDIVYNLPTTYAKVENGVVTNIIVADQNYVDSIGGNWIQTGTNTNHRQASIGDLYQDGYFIAPKPYTSWRLQNGEWVSPIPYPADNKMYIWNESDLKWVAV